MPIYQDQLGRQVEIQNKPERIISVVPSQTELLFYLGLSKKIVGITQFCCHPETETKACLKVGGTKNLNVDLIKSLKPDLIIANKEENERSQIEQLIEICPVWISDIYNLSEARDMIERVGELVGKKEAAKILSQQIGEQFNKLTLQPSLQKAAYFIWRKPYMAAGKNTFIDEMLQKCGLINVFDLERYPVITTEMLIAAHPDVILLSSEPYPFAEKHIREFKVLVPDAIVKLVDGELFSWYGSRLLYAPEYFKTLMDGIKGIR